MNQSRISQLLSQSRSRHQYIKSPQLKKLSGQWLVQKRRSLESRGELRKMMSQMRYLQSLNTRLNKGILNKGKALEAAEQARERYNQDLRKKHELHQQRVQEMVKNRQLANKIKQDRLKKIKAVKQNYFDKESLGDYYRSEGRKLRSMRYENQTREFSQNRNRVEQILEFECNLRESAIKKKQRDNLSHINAYKEAINREKRNQKLNELKTFQLKKRMKALTESSTQKLRQITNINTDILKYKSPYEFRLKKRVLRNLRCETQKTYTERDFDGSSVYVSQYHAID